MTTTPTKNESLPELLARALPFLRDEADKYEDDGSNEPLELSRDIEAALTREAPTEGVVIIERGMETPRRMKAVETLLADGWKWDGTQWTRPPAPHRLAHGECNNPCTPIDFFNGDACDPCVTAHYSPAPQPPHHDRGEVEQRAQELLSAEYRAHPFVRLNAIGDRIAETESALTADEGCALAAVVAALTEAKQQGPGEAVLDLPARVAGRDFAAGQSTRQVIGRAQAHYEVHHEGCLRHPHTGELRDYRDVESDPDGTLCVGPRPLPSADTRQWGNSVLAPMKTVFVIHRPNGTPFQRDDAMGILATESEAQAIRFAHAREDEGAQYVRYVATAPQVEAKRQGPGEAESPSLKQTPAWWVGYSIGHTGRAPYHCIGPDKPPSQYANDSVHWTPLYTAPQVEAKRQTGDGESTVPEEKAESVCVHCFSPPYNWGMVCCKSYYNDPRTEKLTATQARDRRAAAAKPSGEDQ